MNSQIQLPVGVLPLISLCDIIQCEEGFIHPDRIMDVNVALYVYEGSFEVYEEDPEKPGTEEAPATKYTVSAGSLLFLRQGLHHYGRIKCPNGTKWFFVHFHLPSVSEGSLAIEPYEYYLYPEGSGAGITRYYPLPKQLQITDSSLLARFETLAHMYKSESLENRLQMNSYFCRILMDIYQEGLKLRRKDNSEEKTEKMLLFLESHKNEAFSSALLEEYMGLSYKHINLIFKNVTGTTLQKHHAKIRMEAAAKLLRETSLSTGEISSRLGFEDAYYFSNSFKKQFGISPTAFRKSLPII